MTAEGPKLDAGPYIRALEDAAGVDAVIVGKPSADFFGAALDVLGADGATTAMVGDDIVNDVLAAQECGLTGFLVRTGKFSAEALEHSSARPDHVIDSIAELRAHLA
jgi:ribonucleotide monophosphatase NagD (HAD superfamily)